MVPHRNCRYQVGVHPQSCLLFKVYYILLDPCRFPINPCCWLRLLVKTSLKENIENTHIYIYIIIYIYIRSLHNIHTSRDILFQHVNIVSYIHVF